MSDNAPAGRPARTGTAQRPAAAPAAVQPAAQAAATPSAAAAKTVPAQAPAQTLRNVQKKKLLHGHFKPSGHFAVHHQVYLPAEWDFSDVLDPDFWVHVVFPLQTRGSQPRDTFTDGRGTVVEIIPADMAFYGKVIIKGLRRNAQGEANGAYVTCIGPCTDPETGEACPVDLATNKPWRGRKPAAVGAAA